MYADVLIEYSAKAIDQTFTYIIPDRLKEDLDSEPLTISKVKVYHHPGHFCERCWNYEDDAVLQEDGTYLCKRCEKVVK